MRYVLPLGIFGALVVVLAIGLTQDPRLVPSPLIGKPAPDFALSTLHDPARVLTRGDLLGQAFVLNVWASWCATCRDEHPLLLELERSGATRVIGLNYKDERGAADAWLRERGDPYALTLFDPQGRLGLDLGVYGVPETFVIDATGTVRLKHVGALTATVINEQLMPLLASLKRGPS